MVNVALGFLRKPLRRLLGRSPNIPFGRSLVQAPSFSQPPSLSSAVRHWGNFPWAAAAVHPCSDAVMTPTDRVYTGVVPSLACDLVR